MTGPIRGIQLNSNESIANQSFGSRIVSPQENTISSLKSCCCQKNYWQNLKASCYGFFVSVYQFFRTLFCCGPTRPQMEAPAEETPQTQQPTQSTDSAPTEAPVFPPSAPESTVSGALITERINAQIIRAGKEDIILQAIATMAHATNVIAIYRGLHPIKEDMDRIHPLLFMGYFFMNKDRTLNNEAFGKLLVKMRNSQFWEKYLRGASVSFWFVHAEDPGMAARFTQRLNANPDEFHSYVLSLAAALNLDPNGMLPFVNARNWQGLIDHLISNVLK